MAFGLASPAELASACFVKVLQIAFTSCRSQKLVAFTISHRADQKQSPLHFFPSSPFSNPALSTPPFWAPAAVADKNVADICFINFPVVGTISNGLLYTSPSMLVLAPSMVIVPAITPPPLMHGLVVASPSFAFDLSVLLYWYSTQAPAG